MGATLGPKAVQQMEEIARRVLSGVRNASGHRARWMGRGSGKSRCADRNEIHQITIIGSPTSGTFELDYEVNNVSAVLQFNYDDTAGEVATELETHSQIGSGDVTVTAGPFPNATVTVEFTGSIAATAISLPSADWASLTGGAGVAVIVARSISGHPN